LTLVASCSKLPKDYNYVVEKINKFHSDKNRYPKNLEELNINERDLCYYFDDISFNLEFTSWNDLYWYNSGNTVWDFLDGAADNYKCK
jgi:hypothetical protein